MLEYEYMAVVDAIVSFMMVVSCITFFLYLIPFLIKYARGEEVDWFFIEVSGISSFNPFTNNEFGFVLAVPLLTMFIGFIIAFIWIIAVPFIIIMVPLYLIRQKALHKKKVWETLKGS